jgi:hypothetical protein
MCLVWFSKQRKIISLHRIKRLAFVIETGCVYCTLRTEYLNTFRLNSIFKVLLGIVLFLSATLLSCCSSPLSVMTSNTITFSFIHASQLLVLLIGTGFNKVVTTFINNILFDRILHTVLHVPIAAVHVGLKLLAKTGNFKLRCRVFGSIQLITRLLVLFLSVVIIIIIIIIIVAYELLYLTINPVKTELTWISLRIQ